MDYTMKRPCKTCPFRKKGGIRLDPSRIRQIGGMMLDRSGGTFSCHETVDYAAEEDDDTAEEHFPRSGEYHCAGALVFAEKHGNATQMMRIMERLGGYDHRVFTDEVKASVWDTLPQWLKGGSIPRNWGKKTPK